METKRLNEKQSGSIYGQNMCIKTYLYCVCARKRDFTIFNKGLTQLVKGETFFGHYTKLAMICIKYIFGNKRNAVYNQLFNCSAFVKIKGIFWRKFIPRSNTL